MKINLLDFSLSQLKDFFATIGEPAYRAVQVIKWIHQKGVNQIEDMTDLSKSLRQRLLETAVINVPEIAHEQISADGTTKWVLRLFDGQCIETVYIPERGRGTLCISSQVGCVVNCTFCSTAQQGFNRHLSVGEIIGQLWVALHQLAKDKVSRRGIVTNVVMMGMGEPLLNFDNVIPAMELMTEDVAYNLSKYRVTLSTSGIVPRMYELAQLSEVSLAVSLHAPTDELRNILVPINKKYPIKELMLACKDYFKNDPRRQVTFEYVMLDGVNDSPEHAKGLLKILQGVPAKVNLIPFNPFPQSQYKRSSKEAIERFQAILSNAGINTITRKTRGDDIDAACGQLVGKVVDRTYRAKQKLREIPVVLQG